MCLHCHSFDRHVGDGGGSDDDDDAVCNVSFVAVKTKFAYAYTQEFPYRITHILECEFFLLEAMVNEPLLLNRHTYFCRVSGELYQLPLTVTWCVTGTK